MTGTRLPMLGLTLGRQAETLLGSLMSLLLRHLVNSLKQGAETNVKPPILGTGRGLGKGD